MTTTQNIDLMDLNQFVNGEEDNLFAELRQSDPVHWNDEPGGEGFWSLTRYEDVKAAADNPTTYSSAQGTQIVSRRVEGHGPGSLHNMDDPEHAKLRRLTAPELRPAKVRDWQEVIDQVVGELLDDAVRLGEFDFVETVAKQLPMRIVAEVLGVPHADAPKMVDWANRMQSAEAPANADPAAMQAARDEALEYFHDLTEKRRREPQRDLISVLAHATKDGVPLTWEELAAYYIVITAAGNETTRFLTTGGVLALGEDRARWARLRDEPEVLVPAVEEMFRYVSPLSCMRRTLTEDVVVRGQEMRAGDKVVLWFSSANWDESVFDRPREYVMDRTPNEHLSFGWGVHFCLGAHLARAEVRTLFGETVKRGLRFDLAGDPVRLRHNLFRGWTQAPVRVAPIAG
jgi:cytochrome P450